MGMFVAVFSGFLAALLAPWLQRVAPKGAGPVLSLLPVFLALYFWGQIAPVVSGQVLAARFAWMPILGVSLSFYLDGLSLLFSLFITVVGALVIAYAGSYLHGHPALGRFYAVLLCFMASMLGLVLADNAISLFIFWELTSVTSYFLIGFDHDREAARTAALQALLVTGIGGLALMAGFLLLGQIGGTFELSLLADQSQVIRQHGLYPLVLLLIFAGAFTKSAQVPFHFWLPSAMEAPTPVSAYLHSATMVKAGVYLLARLSPTLGGTELWFFVVTFFGALTMIVSAYQALYQTDLKRILAYSTVSVLGTLTLLIGLGSELAIQAAMVFLLAHVLYKAALFLVAGAVDHECGTRDVAQLGGLRQKMPLTGWAACLAALSMAGLPPFFGFIGKESLYEALLYGGHGWGVAIPVVAVGVLTSMLLLAVAWLAGIRPFSGTERETPKHPHEPPLAMWAGPALLAVLGLGFGLFPSAPESLLSSGTQAVLREQAPLHLSLWHGFSIVLFLSLITFAGGGVLYVGREPLRQGTAFTKRFTSRGPSWWYLEGLRFLNWIAAAQTRFLQNGFLRIYLLTVIGTAGILGWYTFLSRARLFAPTGWSEIRFYEWIIALLILFGAIAAARAVSFLRAVVALGVVGYGVAVIFVLFGAPDLAMTQFLIETLSLILFVFVFYYMPHFKRVSSTPTRVRDVIVAMLAGGFFTALVLEATSVQWHPSLSFYFTEHSVLLAHGRNIVNVILVDFRGFDTLGEITVLAVAGIGVYALVRLRMARGNQS